MAKPKTTPAKGKTSNDPVVKAAKGLGRVFAQVFGLTTLEATKARKKKRTKAEHDRVMGRPNKVLFVLAAVFLFPLLLWVAKTVYMIFQEPREPAWYIVGYAFLFLLYLDVGYILRLHPQSPNGRALLVFTGFFGMFAIPLIVQLALDPGVALAIVAAPFIVMMVLFKMHLARAVVLHRAGYRV